MVVDSSRNDRAGIYGSGDIVVKLHDSARDLSRGPSVRGSAAASFSGLPAPSMRTSGSHIIHVKYDKTPRREEPAIYRDTAESFQDTYIPDTYYTNEITTSNLTRDNVIRSSYKVETSSIVAPAPLRSTSGQFVVSDDTDIEQRVKEETQERVLDEHSDSHIELDPGPSAPIPSDYISPVIEQGLVPVDGTYNSYIEPIAPVTEPDILVTTTRMSVLSSDSSHREKEIAETRDVGRRRGFSIFNALEDLIRYHPPQKKY